jgi:hypothetical protein
VSLYVAFAVLFAWGAWRPARELVVPPATAWALFSALHLGSHAARRDGFGAADAVA